LILSPFEIGVISLTTEKKMPVLLQRLILIISIFFTRQGLSDPYQMSSKSESDKDLIILVERKKILMFFFIGNFTIFTLLCDFFVAF
jgi:hypothetical protein